MEITRNSSLKTVKRREEFSYFKAIWDYKSCKKPPEKIKDSLDFFRRYRESAAGEKVPLKQGLKLLIRKRGLMGLQKLVRRFH